MLKTTVVPGVEEWKEWLIHPVTQAYLAALVLWRESLKEQWAQGVMREQPANLVGLAQVKLLEDIQGMDYEKFLQAMGIDTSEVPSTEDEPERP